jgi:hypothetical protein
MKAAKAQNWAVEPQEKKKFNLMQLLVEVFFFP